MALERDIHQLLFTHDCVIVPGFGGFLTHYRPARLDEQRQLVHPPAKDLSFNRHLIRTDGLLTDQVARRTGTDFVRAAQDVETEVQGWQRRLETEGRLELGRIGTFFRDAERNLQFEPDKRVNFLKDAYGLRSVAAVPLAQPKPAVVPQVVPLPVRPAADKEPNPARRSIAWPAAAAAAAVLITAATWWVVTNDSPVGAQWSGFDLFDPAEPRLYTAPAPSPAIIGPAADTLAWSAPTDLTGVRMMPIAGTGGPLVAVDFGEQAPAHKAAVPESTAVAPSAARARYHIIGGCFMEKENADRFVAELQARGFAASLLDMKGGLYRVAYGSYPERAMALEALNAVRKEEAPQAWLLVK